jgi:aspartyl-tRNA synthetase
MSFIDREDIYVLIEGILSRIWKNALNIDLKVPFIRVPFREAMDKYGSDKPDTRFGMEFHDCTDAFRLSSFKVFAQAIADGGVVNAFNATQLARLSQGEMKQFEDAARAMGSMGLAFIKVENGQWKSLILTFLSDAEKTCLRLELDIGEGTSCFSPLVHGKSHVIFWGECFWNAQIWP